MTQPELETLMASVNNHNLKPMGVALVTSDRVDRVNLNYIVKVLEVCSNLRLGCHKCLDLDTCRNAYDVRCSSGEVICPHCKQEVPLGISCPECGFPLQKPSIKTIKKLLATLTEILIFKTENRSLPVTKKKRRK